MAITSTILTRAAGVAAAVGGLLFIAVQIKHPDVNLAFSTTTEWKLREAAKVLLAVLSIAGITGMYLRHVRQVGVLGLIGYVVFTVGYLAMMSLETVGAVVLPSIAPTSPDYVTDVLAVANGGHAAGDIGLMQLLISVMAIGFLGGGFIFGVALFRANVLARWAAALLAVAAVATAAIPLLPSVNQRLFAIPTGVAMIGLGYSLWREQAVQAGRSLPSPVTSHLDRAGAK